MNDLHTAGDLGGESDQAMGPDVSLGGNEHLVVLPFQFVDPGLDGLGLRSGWSLFRLFDGELSVANDSHHQQDDRENDAHHDPK